MPTSSGPSRRDFLLAGTAVGTGFVISGFPIGLRADEPAAPAKGAQPVMADVTPPEDLMREHGILNRVLLIYDETLRRLRRKENFEAAVLISAAKIIRTFIEDYHEKQEEDFVFPPSRRRASCWTSSKPFANSTRPAAV